MFVLCLLCLAAASSAPAGSTRGLAHSKPFYKFVQQFLRRARNKIQDLRETTAELSEYIAYELRCERTCLRRFPVRSDTERGVQLQKMVSGFELWI